MKPLRLLLVSWAVAGASNAGAQAVGTATGPRSEDYLFVSTVADARAIWSNPAGLRMGSFASIMAELVVDRSAGQTRLGQWSVGLSTRGFAFGYQRDRLASDSANQTVRIGAGTAFRRGAVGVSASFYSSDSTSRAVDVGLRYVLLRPVQLGLVIRNIGRPYVRATRLPVTGVAGLSWTSPAGQVVFAGEALMADRFERAGVDVRYRGGTSISIGRRLPVSGLLAVTLDDDLQVLGWTVGLAIGRDRRAVALATAAPADGTPDIDVVSITGVAINRQAIAPRR